MKKEKATIAMGCFWHPDDYFSKLPGVVSTRVGYMGGELKEPNYENIGDHAETTEVIFDPEIISYEELLKEFFNEHDPTADVKPQYRSAIFVNGDDQRAAAEAALAKQQENSRRGVKTQVEDAGEFTQAEDYHQKFYAKKRDEL